MPGLVVRTVQTTFRPGQRLDARECNQDPAARTSRDAPVGGVILDTP